LTCRAADGPAQLEMTQSCLPLLDPPNFVMALLRRNRR
jgi:hypothetical protein